MSADDAVAVAPELLEQGSDAWRAAKCGKFGASTAHVLVPTKGEGKGRLTLIRTIAAERISGVPQGFEGNDDTDFGHEQEPHARRAYSVRVGTFLERAGFVVHHALPYLGASPDGIEPTKRGVEFKSHRKAVKFLEVIDGTIPRAHIIQCQVGMACTGLPEWDYCNWCPQMPEGRRLHIRTVKRDEQLIAEVIVAVRQAEVEVAAIVTAFMEKAA